MLLDIEFIFMPAMFYMNTNMSTKTNRVAESCKSQIKQKYEVQII